jgi:ketopantoate reductase
MQQTSVLYGVGELGGVFARGLLRLGSTVVPVTRSSDPDEVAGRIPDPDVVLVTVGEADLDPILASMPGVWRDRVGLVQNELLPRTWKAHGYEDVTAAIVWFEKKRGKGITEIMPTPIFGPRATHVVAALESIGIGATVVVDPADQMTAMVAKNLYILTANIAGLDTGGTVGELWRDHQELALRVASDVLDIQDALVGSPVDRDAAFAEMLRAFDGDPDHGTTGRSAPSRLARAIGHADEFGIEAKNLREIAGRHLA